MDFKELLLQAERKQKEVAKKAQQTKPVNRGLTTPASKEQKSSQPRSEVIQKLIDEKKKEDRQKKDAEERERRKKEKARQEREREEKRKNTFRIPKKTACEDPPSDAESFSSISSGDEPRLTTTDTQRSAHTDREDTHTASSHRHREDTHTESSHRHREKKDRHSHTSKHSSGHSSKQGSGGGSSRDQDGSHSDRHHSKTDRTKPHPEKPRHGSERGNSGSSHSHRSSDKSQNTNSRHSKTSEQKHAEKKAHIIKDKVMVVGENDSSGYVTSPDISSEDEEPPATSATTPSAKKSVAASGTKHGSSSTDTKQRRQSTSKRRESTDTKQESGDVPVTLTRHHLKPTKDRLGGSMEERVKMLEKLQAIRERMAENEVGPGRKRAANGEVKRRRAKREKLEGDFTGSCMEKVTYDEEDKPSLKRPEPKPEEKKENNVKEKKPRVDKLKEKHKSAGGKQERTVGSRGPGKVNRFDELHGKPQVKPKPRPRPPSINFADLMKLAEQKQAEPVMVEVIPKKEKERRPLTQEEIDRKVAREQRFKSKEYRDWYKYGTSASSKQEDKADTADSQSGGFLRPNHNVVPAENSAGQSNKPFAIPRKGDHAASANAIPRKSDHAGSRNADKHSSSSRPSNPQTSVDRPVPLPKSQPHPTRPGMIANKPQAMAQHLNSERKSEANKAKTQHRNSEHGSEAAQPRGDEKKKMATASSSSQPGPPPASRDRTREGNAWDSLFTRPEYKKMKEAPAPKKRKMVIDSEEEDEYDEEMDDFIDDEEEEDMGNVSSMIQQMFRYDKKKYRYEDDDDSDMEVGFSQVMKEEARSARLGLQEDLEDIRREQEELKMKAMKKKMKKR